MKSFAELLVDLQTRKWNSLVPERYRFVRETETHFTFLHPTKGFRSISKRRLAL
jgi:hypothetical protein